MRNFGDNKTMHHNTKFISYGRELHHCASITKNIDGYFIANYIGKECTDFQRVVIGFFDKPAGHVIDSTELHNKTGNPIVWTFKDQAYLLYSYFSDSTKDGLPISYGSRPVERWKNCTNHLAKIDFDGNKVKVEDVGMINGMYGLLGRCQPLIEKDRVLLPLYREEDPLCQIWSFDGSGFNKLSDFGELTAELAGRLPEIGMTTGSLGAGVAIQPSLVYHNGSYHAYCRNVCRAMNKESDLKFTAWAAKSPNCEEWSPVKLSGIPNHNNSLAVIHRNYDDEKDGFVVFNTNRYRNDMILYGIKNKISLNLQHNFKRSRQSFSYPNLMWEDDSLHVVHTNCYGMIAWHYFDKEYMIEAFGA